MMVNGGKCLDALFVIEFEIVEEIIWEMEKLSRAQGSHCISIRHSRKEDLPRFMGSKGRGGLSSFINDLNWNV